MLVEYTVILVMYHDFFSIMKIVDAYNNTQKGKDN